MCGSCISGGTAVMSDQAEKGGNFQFLGGNITGKFLEVKEDFLSTVLYLTTVGQLSYKRLPKGTS
jgi:hypothetical protein